MTSSLAVIEESSSAVSVVIEEAEKGKDTWLLESPWVEFIAGKYVWNICTCEFKMWQVVSYLNKTIHSFLKSNSWQPTVTPF